MAPAGSYKVNFCAIFGAPIPTSGPIRYEWDEVAEEPAE